MPRAALVASFLAYSPAFRGGVEVAVGDVNGDGTPDIITGTVPAADRQVEVFDGTKLKEVQANGTCPRRPCWPRFMPTLPRSPAGSMSRPGTWKITASRRDHRSGPRRRAGGRNIQLRARFAAGRADAHMVYSFFSHTLRRSTAASAWPRAISTEIAMRM